jgi:Holliday junction resolvasome RuvABC endonuclease subunit
MKYAAFDLALNTGFCVGQSFDANNPKKLLSGSHNFQKGSNRHKGDRFLRALLWFENFLEDHEPDVVYYEEVTFSHHKGSTVYGGLFSILAALCRAHNVHMIGVNVKVLKKHATGNGNATKAMMIDSCRSYGIDPVDDDEADAVCLYQYAVCTSDR